MDSRHDPAGANCSRDVGRRRAPARRKPDLYTPPALSPAPHQSRIVLLGSYPRSGSNWVGQVLRLAESWHAGIDPDRVGLFHDLEIVRDRRDPASLGQPVGAPSVILKTHELPSVVFDRSPTLRGNVRAVANIVRHPLDVLASAFRWSVLVGRVNHEGVAVRSVDEARRLGLLDVYVDEYLRYAGMPDFSMWGYGTWAQHVRAWGGEEGEGVPIVRVLYRDLVAHPHETFETLAEGLGMHADHSCLRRAIQTCTPEWIASMFPIGFVHRASDRTYADTLSPGQIERGLAVFGDDIERLGL